MLLKPTYSYNLKIPHREEKNLSEIFQPFLPGLRVHPNQHAHDNNQAGRKQYYYRTHIIMILKFYTLQTQTRKK